MKIITYHQVYNAIEQEKERIHQCRTAEIPSIDYPCDAFYLSTIFQYSTRIVEKKINFLLECPKGLVVPCTHFHGHHTYRAFLRLFQRQPRWNDGYHDGLCYVQGYYEQLQRSCSAAERKIHFV